MKDEKELTKNIDICCFCGGELWFDSECEQYICSKCGEPEDECECEEPQTDNK